MLNIKDIVRVISYANLIDSLSIVETLQEDITGRIGIVEHIHHSGKIGVRFSDTFKVFHNMHGLRAAKYWIFEEHQLGVLFTS